jgi:hypothetical protein
MPIWYSMQQFFCELIYWCKNFSFFLRLDRATETERAETTAQSKVRIMSLHITFNLNFILTLKKTFSEFCERNVGLFLEMWIVIIGTVQLFSLFLDSYRSNCPNVLSV